MSAPAAGGRTITLNVGAAPQLLTEYVPTDQPLYVINAEPAAGRVWLASDSSVSPANGVPLDAGTSIPWNMPGQLWAVADPAATAAVQIVLTTAITDWSPSPAAIAAQVAAQLLSQGVPIVATSKQLFSGSLASGAAATVLDTSDWTALSLSFQPPSTLLGLQYALIAVWNDGGTPTQVDTVTFHSLNSYAVPVSRFLWQLPVRATGLSLYLEGGNPGDTIPAALATGNTRQIAAPSLTPARLNFTGVPSAAGRRIMSTGSNTIPAGASAGPFYIPPSARQLVLNTTYAVTAVHYVLAGVTWFANAIVANNFLTVAGQAGGFSSDPLDAPGVGLELTIFNDDTVARTGTVIAWDVS